MFLDFTKQNVQKNLNKMHFATKIVTTKQTRDTETIKYSLYLSRELYLKSANCRVKMHKPSDTILNKSSFYLLTVTEIVVLTENEMLFCFLNNTSRTMTVLFIKSTLIILLNLLIGKYFTCPKKSEIVKKS